MTARTPRYEIWHRQDGTWRFHLGELSLSQAEECFDSLDHDGWTVELIETKHRTLVRTNADVL